MVDFPIDIFIRDLSVGQDFWKFELSYIPFLSDSDQKSMIDHFLLIGWKTVNFFSIMEFQSSIFDHLILE